MNESFFVYLYRLELIAFFSGYPLLYTVVLMIAAKRHESSDLVKGPPFRLLLSYCYALVATLYVGFELNNFSPGYWIDNFKRLAYHPYLVMLGFAGTLFWIPALARRPVFTLLHSLVFFALLINDVFFPGKDPLENRDTIKNGMKLYTASILLHCFSFMLVMVIYYLKRWFKRTRWSSRLLR